MSFLNKRLLVGLCILFEKNAKREYNEKSTAYAMLFLSVTNHLDTGCLYQFIYSVGVI